MLLFYDTETTGLPDWHSPSTAPHQPHVVQLAYLVTTNDGEEIAGQNVIIRPDGWTIPDEVAAIHGITTQIALERGVPRAEVLEEWLVWRRQAHLRIAHNISFDERLMRIALLRHGLTREDIEGLEGGAMFCTMRAASKIMKMAATQRMIDAGYGHKPKPPKLSEAILHFFGETLEGAHDALVDVRATARVYFHLKSLERAAA